jgi:hypothetical protein
MQAPPRILLRRHIFILNTTGVGFQETTNTEVGETLAKLQSGRSMRPKERFRLYKLLEAEEARLEKADDEHGLQTQELRVLKQLQTMRREREERKNNRKAQQDYMKLMMDSM